MEKNVLFFSNYRMSMKRKRYTAKEKFEIVIELLKWRKTQAQITSEYWVHPTQQNTRKDQFMKQGADVFAKEDNSALEEKWKEVERLHKIIGQYAVEVDWLQKKINSL
jgi:transposase